MGYFAAGGVRCGSALFDLVLADTLRAPRLGSVLQQAAHLLTPTDPAYSLSDVLFSRVSHDADWGAQAANLTAGREVPRADQRMAAA